MGGEAGYLVLPPKEEKLTLIRKVHRRQVANGCMRVGLKDGLLALQERRRESEQEGQGHLQEDRGSEGGRLALAGGGGRGRGSSRIGQAVGEGSPTVPPRLLSGMQAGRSSALHWPHLLKLSLQLRDWTQKREGQRQSPCRPIPDSVSDCWEATCDRSQGGGPQCHSAICISQVSKCLCLSQRWRARPGRWAEEEVGGGCPAEA